MSKHNYDAYENDIMEKSHSPKQNKSKKSNKNYNKKKNVNKKKKRSFKAKFFMFLTVLFTAGCIAVSAFLVWFYLVGYDKLNSPGIKTTDDSTKNTFMEMVLPTLPERTNFLVVGTDEDGTRTDTIMVGCYNDELGELTILSIPRDTIVTVDDETYAKMQEHYPEPGSHSMKINAIHHYGTSTDDENDTRELGFDLLEEWIEDTIGAEIDYRVRIDFEAFDYLIDEIGGIEYNVPMRMYYSDPGQDLYIDLQPGLQTLNGKQAEGLVRFRYGYVNGDIGRVEQQQSFMKELIKQLASKDVIFDNPTAFISTFFKYIDTNISLTDAGTFIKIFKKFDPENVVTYTLPGYIGSTNGITGGYIMNEEETAELCNEIFVKPSSQIIQEREAAAAADTQTAANATKFNDKELEIQVLNGSYTNGLATKTMTELTSLGYNVKSSGTYPGEKTNHTRIYVKEDGMAETLIDNFPDCEIIVDSQVEFTEKYDIVIILGIGE